jgi:hypothetical protein
MQRCWHKAGLGLGGQVNLSARTLLITANPNASSIGISFPSMLCKNLGLIPSGISTMLAFHGNYVLTETTRLND